MHNKLVLARFFENLVATTLDQSLSGPGTIPRLPKAVQSGFLPKKAKKTDWTGLLNSNHTGHLFPSDNEAHTMLPLLHEWFAFHQFAIMQKDVAKQTAYDSQKNHNGAIGNCRLSNLSPCVGKAGSHRSCRKHRKDCRRGHP